LPTGKIAYWQRCQYPGLVFQTSHPVSVDLRWYHEFSSENRLEGDGIFLTISVPLHIRPARDEAQDWTRAQEVGSIR